MTRKRETIDEYTERAIRMTEAGKLIPPIVYLPRNLRAQKVRLTYDNLVATVVPPTVEENHVRIQEADPLGFLIAIMHGQPFPEFTIEDDHTTNQSVVKVNYLVPSLQTRIASAEYLARRITSRPDRNKKSLPDPQQEEWEALVEDRTGSRHSQNEETE